MFFEVDELGQFFGEECPSVTFEDSRKNIKFFKQKIGDHWFEKGSVAAMERYAKSLGSYHSTQVAQFEDSSGNMCNRTCAFISNLPGFITKIVLERDIKNPPALVLGADDVGCNKLLLTLSVLDKDYYKTLQASYIKPGSKIFVLAMCDDLDSKVSQYLLLC